MRFPDPCRWANPALPINRRDAIRPATRTSRLFASSSGPGVWLYFSTSAAGVSVQRNSRGYGSCPSASICWSFFWRCSNWSRGSNCNWKSSRNGVHASIAARVGIGQENAEFWSRRTLTPQSLPYGRTPHSFFGNHSDSPRIFFAILPTLFPGRTLVKDSVRTPLARGASVEKDWRTWLPQEQEKVFRIHVQELESNYTMLSISLNEALELRREQRIGQSLQAVCFSSELCLLLTGPLGGLLRALYEHAKHYGTIPNAALLDPANFQGQKSQKSARLSNLLSRVLLSHRLQFLHKVSILGEMVEDLGKNYCLCAADPADQLGAFQQTIFEQSKPRQSEAHTRLQGIRHRRMTPIAGQ